jgi:hypothetical protein
MDGDGDMITDPARMLSAKPQHEIIASGWLWEALNPERRREVVARAKHALSQLHFDAIAVTGISGILVGSVIAMEMDKPLIIVRKRGEQRHSAFDVEGVFGGETYVILDDFVSSGSTIARVERKVAETARMSHMHPLRCLGVLEYGCCSPRWNPRREWAANLWSESKHESETFDPWRAR